MDVHVGDEILVGEHHAVHRRCEILKILDPEGEGPYLVRWADDGREVVFVPGPHASRLD